MAIFYIFNFVSGKTMKKPQSNQLNPRIFRAVLGFVAVTGGFLGLGGLYFIPIPDGNREPLLLALGLVLGWGSTVIGYEFGSSPSGRKAADAGVRPARPST